MYEEVISLRKIIKSGVAGCAVSLLVSKLVQVSSRELAFFKKMTLNLFIAYVFKHSSSFGNRAFRFIVHGIENKNGLIYLPRFSRQLARSCYLM